MRQMLAIALFDEDFHKLQRTNAAANIKIQRTKFGTWTNTGSIECVCIVGDECGSFSLTGAYDGSNATRSVSCMMV
jgi:hypothetical protein